MRIKIFTQSITVSNSSYPVDWIIIVPLIINILTFNSDRRIGSCYCLTKGWSQTKLRIVPKSKNPDKLFDFEYSHNVKKCLILLQELKVRLDPGASLAQMQQGLKSRGIPRGGTDYSQPGGWGDSLFWGHSMFWGHSLFWDHYLFWDKYLFWEPIARGIEANRGDVYNFTMQDL